MAKWLLAYGAGGCWSGYPEATIIEVEDNTRDAAMKVGICRAVEATLVERRRGHGTSCDVEEIKSHYRDTALYHNRLKPSARIMLAQDFPDRAPGQLADGRYITGEWGHLFTRRRALSTVRLVFDKEVRMIVAMHVLQSAGYRYATLDERVDVQDSFMSANGDVIANPYAFGMEFASELPTWAQAPEQEQSMAFGSFPSTPPANWQGDPDIPW